MRNHDFSKTTLKKNEGKKKLENFNFSRWILEKKKRKQTFRKMAANNLKKLFVNPVRLMKTLSGIYYDSTNNNNINKKISTNNDNKISTNSHLPHQLQPCQKRHLKMRSMEEKKMVDEWLMKKKETLHQTATLC